MYRKENIKIMKYNKNDDIVDMLNNIINLEDISKAELARRIGISPQGLNAIFTKKNINLDDIKRIADALGYDVEIELVNRNAAWIETAQRKMMGAILHNENITLKTPGDFLFLGKTLKDIYTRLEALDKRTQNIKKSDAEENKTDEAPAPKEAEQSEADGMDGEKMK